ncbi:MAG: hypothetical protein J6D52_06350 [Clostridia bacterium]|nr:hypothetical protein [Clostridia bacterium]
MKSLILKLGVVLFALSIIVSPITAAAKEEPTVSVSKVTAVAEDEIIINIDISNNPGIQAMSFTVSYDPAAVTYVKTTRGGLSDYMFANHSEDGYVSFVNCESTNISYNGTIFSITFTVNQDVAPGEYAFKIQNINPQKNGDSLKGCFANKEHTPINPIIKNGSVTIGETCANSGHKFSSWQETLKPSCEEKGAKTRSCTREYCGHTELEEIAAVGHDFADEWTIDKTATAESQGIMSRHCKSCSATKDETYFDLEISEENNFENVQDQIVPPESWDVLEEIIEEEKREEAAKEEEQKASSDNKSSDSDFFSTRNIIIICICYF